ncbi:MULTISPECIES: serine/threonine-protein kinase [unclassified Streptomyces]|uniref:serine/threonine-protein kinase n=1 Tax=unclassified Streptomyces TaxID=2593676 RepID=UPI0016610304|nr:MULTISPECIES: serine/threonine-protein kinase [unclassified Streptomyces]MBD0708326.1 serine/threonine protein kinase [Streptomyces sp. CBMA291]MBD0717382.1 serine/threonine protein kinase [Streptomyces sp. CBMA370]
MGEVFAGRYELVDPIGRGGAGAVWRAWDHRRRRYVAAKVLLQSDAHTLLRFVREQALRIDHPHVLAPASWAADDDKVLFTMDLVAGGSLAEVVRDQGPLPPRFVCVLLDQLLSGLASVHAEGVVHRDVKPANLLLEVTGTGRPHLRLSDFGIAMRKGEPRLTETAYVVGTPGYLAPEQLYGAEPDVPADLFAVGLVALHLLQGRKPDSGALVAHFVEHGTPGAPEGVPEPLWQVLAGLLQPDPQTRFRTATGARKALGAAVELLPEPRPDAHPVSVLDRLGPLPPGFGPEGPVTRPAPPASPVDPSETGSFRLPAPVTGPAAPTSERTPTAAPPSTGAPAPMAAPAAYGPPVPSPYAPPYTAHPTAAPATPAAQNPYATTGPMTGPTAGPAAGLTGPMTGPTAGPTGLMAGPAGPMTGPTPPVPYVSQSSPAPARRAGPPAKVAVPVLLLALLCYAVGFWALGRI